jgi:exodeoxyribonuclease VII large subunit
LANTRAHHTRFAQVAARLQPRLVAGRIARLRDGLAALGNRKRDGLARLAASRRARYEGARGRLRPAPIVQRISRAGDMLEALRARSNRALCNQIGAGRHRLDARAQMLAALSYQGVLARGFAIVRDGNGVMVRSAQVVMAGAALGIEFGDGSVRVQAIEDGVGKLDAPVSKPVRRRTGQLGAATRGATPPGAGSETEPKPANAVRVSKPRTPSKSGTGGSGAGGQGTLF